MKRLVFFIFCLCLYFSGSAQPFPGKTTADSLHTLRPAYIIKWAPFSVLDVDPTVQAGMEYLLQGPWSLQQELGYGHFNYRRTTLSGNNLWNKEVWRSRSEVRLYLSKYKPRPTGIYTAFELLYKRVNFNQEANVGRECEEGQCNYFEIVRYKVLRDIVGYHLKIGGQALIEKRVVLDFYTGLGFRNIYVKTPGRGIVESRGWWGEEEGYITIYPNSQGNYRLISGNLGFKVGYLIYRR